MHPQSPPLLTVRELADKLRSASRFVVLDIRETWELDLARIEDSRVCALPMSRLAREGVGALPAEAATPQSEILVLCHQGVRSAQVAAWLGSKGWTNAFSVSGGIDQYAREIDPSVGSY